MTITPTSPRLFWPPPVELAREECQRERINTNDEAERARRLGNVNELVGGVVHDFNNILCIISAHAEFLAEALSSEAVTPLRDSADREDAQDSVETIKLAAKRGADLVRLLLDVTSRPAAPVAALDVKDMMREVGRLLKRSLGGNVSLVTAVSPGTWPILIDSGQCERIFLNLAANAQHAMKTGGVLTIAAENAPAIAPAHDMVQFRVSDTGIGMTPDTLRHVFEPHFTTKSVSEGSGLGLSSVQRIVRDAGGTVVIESEPGTGTIVDLTLPAATKASLTT